MTAPTPYYSDDLVTLYHGDCREITEWLEADVLVTDPPYGVRWESRHGDNRDPRARRGRTSNAVAGDDSPEARDGALVEWAGRPAVVFGSWRIPRPAPLRALLIWNKDGAYSAMCRSAFFTVHEEIYVLGDGFPMEGKPMRSVITTTEHRSQHTAAIGHPTPKPVDLMARLIDRCPPGVIADPFAGSGSTLVAAKRLGRKAIGVELDERYCDHLTYAIPAGTPHTAAELAAARETATTTPTARPPTPDPPNRRPTPPDQELTTMATKPPMTATEIGLVANRGNVEEMGVEIILDARNHYFVTAADLVSGGPGRPPVLVLNVAHWSNFRDTA